MAGERTHWQEISTRIISVNARVFHELDVFTVPLRLLVVMHSLHHNWYVRVPLLQLETAVSHSQISDDFLVEWIGHALFNLPLSRILALTNAHSETIETIAVSYKPSAKIHKSEEKSNKTVDVIPPVVAEVCRALHVEAANSILDRAFQRGQEIAQIVGYLSHKSRGSVVLVGPRGSGKTAIVGEIAYLTREDERKSPLLGTEIYSTSGARVIAGMRYLGQWQRRFSQVIDLLRSRRSVLHIESLAEFTATGRQDAGLDIARFLTTSVEAGEVVLVTEATEEDLAKIERTHPSLVACLRRVHIRPLEGQQAHAAVSAAAGKIAKDLGVRFLPTAIEQSIELTERFGMDAVLPGGAIQLLRVARHENQHTHQNTNTGHHALQNSDRDGEQQHRVVTADDVLTGFVDQTGYPREIVDPRTTLDPERVLAFFKERVTGQDDAMVLLRDLVVTLKTGLTDPSRPLGSFLLLGPTGVGKTESALALAAYLFGDPKRMARFDMAEYATPGSATRLVSEWKGMEGVLTRTVREQPFGVVLLDEIEKADTSVHDLLLQILGEARLTDTAGRTVSFRNTVIVLTSNLGADDVGRSLGFSTKNPGGITSHYLAAATAFFRPELLNRLDHIVPYRALSHDTVKQIARRALERALEREGLTHRGVHVYYTDEVVDHLVELGFDPRLGARPLNRAIERWVVGPLARLLSAKGMGVPSRLELVGRFDEIVIAPCGWDEVASLSLRELKVELTRCAELLWRQYIETGSYTGSLREKHLALVVRKTQGDQAGIWMQWLIQVYTQWGQMFCDSVETVEHSDSHCMLVFSGTNSIVLALEHGFHGIDDNGTRHAVVTDVDRNVVDRLKVSVGARKYQVQSLVEVFDRSGASEVIAHKQLLNPEQLSRFLLMRRLVHFQSVTGENELLGAVAQNEVM